MGESGPGREGWACVKYRKDFWVISGDETKMANAKWEVGILSLAELCLGSVANIAHSLDPVTFVSKWRHINTKICSYSDN